MSLLKVSLHHTYFDVHHHTLMHTHIQPPFSMPSQHMTRARVRMEQQKAEHDKMQALTKVCLYVHNSVCNFILHALLW